MNRKYESKQYTDSQYFRQKQMPRLKHFNPLIWEISMFIGTLKGLRKH